MCTFFNGAQRSEFVYSDDDGETLDYRKVSRGRQLESLHAQWRRPW
jgi:hypothetical protein